jgi:hypothetical protein
VPVLAQQQGLRGHGQVDEFLVVGIAAGHGGLGGHFRQARMPVKGGQHITGIQFIKRQARHDLRIGQHALEFVAHGLRGQPVEFAGFQRFSEGLRGRIVEDKHVEDDVGVQHDGLARRSRHAAGSSGAVGAAAPGLPRAEPATMSKRNSRHSIGPFHIGTRRDSFRRILPGSLRSGVSTWAVQPA